MQAEARLAKAAPEADWSEMSRFKESVEEQAAWVLGDRTAHAHCSSRH